MAGATPVRIVGEAVGNHVVLRGAQEPVRERAFLQRLPAPHGRRFVLLGRDAARHADPDGLRAALYDAVHDAATASPPPSELWLGVDGLGTRDDLLADLARAGGLDVLGPVGRLSFAAGSAIVASGADGSPGWWRSSGGAPAEPDGWRFPARPWEQSVPDVRAAGPAMTATQVLAGLAVRAADAPPVGGGDLAFHVVGGRRAARLVVDDPPPEPDDVAALLAEFPAPLPTVVALSRSAAEPEWLAAVSGATCGPVLVAPCASLLTADGEVRDVVLDEAGRERFDPFPTVLSVEPDGVQCVVVAAPPPTGWRSAGVAEYASSEADGIRVHVVPSGLVLGRGPEPEPDDERRFDPTGWTLEVGGPDDPADDALRAAAERLVADLDPGRRAAMRVVEYGPGGVPTDPVAGGPVAEDVPPAAERDPAVVERAPATVAHDEPARPMRAGHATGVPEGRAARVARRRAAQISAVQGPAAREPRSGVVEESGRPEGESRGPAARPDPGPRTPAEQPPAPPPPGGGGGAAGARAPGAPDELAAPDGEQIRPVPRVPPPMPPAPAPVATSTPGPVPVVEARAVPPRDGRPDEPADDAPEPREAPVAVDDDRVPESALEVPDRPSTTAEQSRFTAAAGDEFTEALAAVNSAMATWPALRGGSGYDAGSGAKADLAAVYLYLDGRERSGAADVDDAIRRGHEGAVDGQLPCLVSGLRRLPVHRRPVLRQCTEEVRAEQGATGRMLGEAAFLSASTELDVTVPDARYDVLIMPATARRTGELVGGAGSVAEVVFPAGARYRTLALHEAEAAEESGIPRAALLLRELAPDETTGVAAELDARDRAALSRLERALAARRRATARLVDDPVVVARLTRRMSVAGPAGAEAGRTGPATAPPASDPGPSVGSPGTPAGSGS